MKIGGDTYKTCLRHKVKFNAEAKTCPLCLNPLISNYPTKVGTRDPVIHTPQNIKAKNRKDYMRLYKEKNREKLRVYKRTWARSSRANGYE